MPSPHTTVTFSRLVKNSAVENVTFTSDPDTKVVEGEVLKVGYVLARSVIDMVAESVPEEVKERVLVKEGEATPWLLEAESVPELAVHESRL